MFLKIQKTHLLSNGQFFHEICQFFDVSEITGVNGSLILILLTKIRTGSYRILKILKNYNRQLGF